MYTFLHACKLKQLKKKFKIIIVHFYVIVKSNSNQSTSIFNVKRRISTSTSDQAASLDHLPLASMVLAFELIKFVLDY